MNTSNVTHLDSRIQAQSAESAPTLVNGIDPAAITAAAAGLAAQPAAAAVEFRARTSWQGRVRSNTEIGGHEVGGQSFVRNHRLPSDEPLELFGTDTAPNPQDMLLAALNACMMVSFVAAATVRGIRIEALSIESSLAFDLRGVFQLDGVAPGAEGIRYVVRVKADATREQLEECNRDMMATSPNRWHLSRPMTLIPQLIVD